MERWMNFQWKHPPIFQTFRGTNVNVSSNNLDATEKEVRRIAHTNFSVEETSLQDDTSGPNLGWRVIFLAYRMYNPTVQYIMSLFRNIQQ